MRLLELVLEVRLGSKTSLVKNDLRLELMDKIKPGLSKQAPEPSPNVVNGVDINLQDNKGTVVAQENRYGVSIRNTKDIENVKEQLLKYLSLIHETIDYSGINILRFGVKTSWIQKCDLEFSGLVNTYKEKFFVKNKLIETAKDYAVVLELKNNDMIVDYTSGPVEKNEPLMGISFPVDGLNDANIFTIVDCSLTNKPKLTNKQMVAYIEKSLKYGEEKSKETLEILGVES